MWGCGMSRRQRLEHAGGCECASAAFGHLTESDLSLVHRRGMQCTQHCTCSSCYSYTTL